MCFEHVHEPCCSRISNLQLALEIRSGGTTDLLDRGACIFVEVIIDIIILKIIVRESDDIIWFSADATTVEIDAREVACVMALDITHHLSHFLFTDERGLNAHRLRHIAREIEHIAGAEQGLRTRTIKDGAGIYLRKPDDGRFELSREAVHDVSELVDDDDDEGKRFGHTWVAFSAGGGSASGGLRRLKNSGVVRINIAH